MSIFVEILKVPKTQKNIGICPPSLISHFTPTTNHTNPQKTIRKNEKSESAHNLLSSFPAICTHPILRRLAAWANWRQEASVHFAQAQLQSPRHMPRNLTKNKFSSKVLRGSILNGSRGSMGVMAKFWFGGVGVLGGHVYSNLFELGKNKKTLPLFCFMGN